MTAMTHADATSTGKIEVELGRKPGDEACNRIFPIVRADLYTRSFDSVEVAEFPIGTSMLGLASRRLNIFQRLSGWGVKPLGQLSRLLLFHKLAMQAELQGQHQRADFFWTETYGQLRSLVESRIWQGA